MTGADPFYLYTVSGHELSDVTAEDRMRRVRTFDRAQCRAALAMEDLQRTVRRAVERRLRALGRLEQ